MLEEHRSDVPHVGHLVDAESRQNGLSAIVSGPRESLLPLPSAETVLPRHASPIQLPSLSQQHPPPQDGIISQLQSSLQSQLHVHSQILEEQRQEIDSQRHRLARIDGIIESFQHEQRNLYAMIDEVRHEVRSRGPNPDHPDTREVDILTEQVQHIGAKANEIEGLRMQLNILRNQVRRLERHGSPVAGAVESTGHEQIIGGHMPSVPPFVTNTPSATEPRQVLYQTPADARLPAPIVANPELSEPRVSSEPRMLPGFRSIDPTSSTITSWRPAGAIASAQSSAPVAASSPQIEPPAPGSGWASVNSNSAPKRLASENVPFDSPLPGSPKRQRLAPLMPRTNYEQSSAPGSSPYHSVSDSLPTVPTLQSTKNPSNESSGSIHTPSNGLRFVQFASGSEPAPEEGWRQDASRSAGPMGDKTRGSPRRGRGGRGRGGRKSGGLDGDRATPDWEMHPEQIQNDHHADGLGGPVRQTGPAGPTADHPVETAAGMYPDPHFMPITTSADVASSSQPTKKTRTKPVRNAEGVLIRKDGRPDMRSVSSAMNLKKVHAKKEAERANNKETSTASEDTKDKSSAYTPHSASEHEAGDVSAGSPSASSVHERAADSEVSAQERRHQDYMRKIFPSGYDVGTGGASAQSMAQQFFPKPDHSRAAPEIKIEAMVGDDKSHEASQKGSEGSKPLVDGEKSMLHHTEGHVDTEMGDAE